MNSLDALCYIQEQTSYEDDYLNNFGYERVDEGSRFYIKFPAVLQSFGVRNRNGREYDAQNIMNCIETDDYIQSQLKCNSWMGEIDHPAPQHQGEELTIQRIANPNMEKTSHYIRSPRLNGNLLEANIQTDSSTDAGMNMAIKIVDGKIVPCFSARVLGAMNNNGGRRIVKVRKLVTYDWVLYPSHSEAMAKINQPLQESVNIMENYMNQKIIMFPELAKMAAKSSEETKMLCEAFELSEDDIIGVTESGNSIVVKENSNIYVQHLSDKIIRKKTKQNLIDWLNI